LIRQDTEAPVGLQIIGSLTPGLGTNPSIQETDWEAAHAGGRCSVVRPL